MCVVFSDLNLVINYLYTTFTSLSFFLLLFIISVITYRIVYVFNEFVRWHFYIEILIRTCKTQGTIPILLWNFVITFYFIISADQIIYLYPFIRYYQYLLYWNKLFLYLLQFNSLDTTVNLLKKKVLLKVVIKTKNLVVITKNQGFFVSFLFPPTKYYNFIYNFIYFFVNMTMTFSS